MIEYAGPIPPEPVAPFDAAQWNVWQTYQTLLQNIRLANEREARVLVTDKQHADRLAADAACATSGENQATGMKALAAAMLEYASAIRAAYATPDPVPAPAPIPLPVPDPAVSTLLADAFAVLRRLQAAYAAPRTSP